MNNYKGSIERYLDAKAHTDSIQQNHQYQKAMIMQQREHEKEKEEIVSETLSRIAVSVDTKNAVMNIRDIKQAIDGLTKQ